MFLLMGMDMWRSTRLDRLRGSRQLSMLHNDPVGLKGDLAIGSSRVTHGEWSGKADKPPQSPAYEYERLAELRL